MSTGLRSTRQSDIRLQINEQLDVLTNAYQQVPYQLVGDMSVLCSQAVSAAPTWPEKSRFKCSP